MEKQIYNNLLKTKMNLQDRLDRGIISAEQYERIFKAEVCIALRETHDYFSALIAPLVTQKNQAVLKIWDLEK